MYISHYATAFIDRGASIVRNLLRQGWIKETKNAAVSALHSMRAAHYADIHITPEFSPLILYRTEGLSKHVLCITQPAFKHSEHKATSPFVEVR
jgi:hypothetical protein